MRLIRYPGGPKRPTHTDQRNLGELVMLTEAAISVTNVRRWAQKRMEETAAARAVTKSKQHPKEPYYASVVPAAVSERAKARQYEVSVVDEFVQLGAQSFAAHGTEALWERPIIRRGSGRPKSIDVSLFNSKRGEESRLEFGDYSRSKLQKDAAKLANIRHFNGLKVTNYLILWRFQEVALTHASINAWRDLCINDARRASSARQDVRARVVSGQDLFVAIEDSNRVLEVALFSVDVKGLAAQEDAGDI